MNNQHSQTAVNPEALQAAEQYLETHAMHWTLDPTSGVVEQPENQDAIVSNLQTALGQEAHGEELVNSLNDNLQTLYELADEADSRGVFLDIKPAQEVAVALPEQQELRYIGNSNNEPIATADSPNLMLSALLAATGATTLRDDFELGEQEKGNRVYAGMLNGRRVYLSEIILPRYPVKKPYDQQEAQQTTYWERRVVALSEAAARERLEQPTVSDIEVLRTLGEMGGRQQHTRTRILEVIGWLAALNPGEPGHTRSN